MIEIYTAPAEYLPENWQPQAATLDYLRRGMDLIDEVDLGDGEEEVFEQFRATPLAPFLPDRGKARPFGAVVGSESLRRIRAELSVGPWPVVLDGLLYERLLEATSTAAEQGDSVVLIVA